MNKFDFENTPSIKGKSFNKGLNSMYEFEGKFYVIMVKENLPVMRKEFSEAKGAATSDYQNYLEKNWLEDLRKKHSLSVDKNVLYSLGSN
jgi:peptidyl-prolyl cis-trans isomerase SurA